MTAAGNFLPMQLNYTGRTQRCHPKGVSFPEGLDVTHSKNHWDKEHLAIQHLENIIMPYFEAMHEDLGVP